MTRDERSKDENATKARMGMNAAEKFLHKWGFSSIERVDKKRVDKKGYGCDFKASKDGLPFTIEVKTTQTKGVPDAFGTEFNLPAGNGLSNFEFKPDYLLVVVVEKAEDGSFHPKRGVLVKKDEVNKYEDHKPVTHVKFSREFQRDLMDGSKKIGEWLDWTED